MTDSTFTLYEDGTASYGELLLHFPSFSPGPASAATGYQTELTWDKATGRGISVLLHAGIPVAGKGSRFRVQGDATYSDAEADDRFDALLISHGGDGSYFLHALKYDSRKWLDPWYRHGYNQLPERNFGTLEEGSAATHPAGPLQASGETG